MNKYNVLTAADCSYPERPQWWVSKIVNRELEIVAMCYGFQKSEAEARANVCAMALEQPTAVKSINAPNLLAQCQANRETLLKESAALRAACQQVLSQLERNNEVSPVPWTLNAADTIRAALPMEAV